MPDPVRDPDRPDDLFRIREYPYLHGDGDSVRFLVERLRDEDARLIVITEDAQGFREITVDGGEFYDVTTEPEFLTFALLDDTTATLTRVRDAIALVDGLILSAPMDPRRVH